MHEQNCWVLVRKEGVEDDSLAVWGFLAHIWSFQSFIMSLQSHITWVIQIKTISLPSSVVKLDPKKAVLKSDGPGRSPGLHGGSGSLSLGFGVRHVWLFHGFWTSVLNLQDWVSTHFRGALLKPYLARCYVSMSSHFIYGPDTVSNICLKHFWSTVPENWHPNQAFVNSSRKSKALELGLKKWVIGGERGQRTTTGETEISPTFSSPILLSFLH